MTRTRTIIVDDHPAFRHSLRQFVESLGGLEVVGEAADGRAALSMLDSQEADLVMMDICMPQMNGVEACRAMRSNDESLQVVLYSGDTLEFELADEQHVASFCVAKDRLFEELPKWLRQTFEGSEGQRK